MGGFASTVEKWNKQGEGTAASWKNRAAQSNNAPTRAAGAYYGGLYDIGHDIIGTPPEIPDPGTAPPIGNEGGYLQAAARAAQKARQQATGGVGGTFLSPRGSAVAPKLGQPILLGGKL